MIYNYVVTKVIILILTVEPMNQDYIPHPIAVQFDPRNPSTPICAEFIIFDDNIPPTLAEDDEYFLVSLKSNDNADVIPAESIAQVVIRDNDGMYSEAFI